MELRLMILLGVCLVFTICSFTNGLATTRWKVYHIMFNGKYGCWPNNTVLYTILPGFSDAQVKHILQQILTINSRTCVRWVEKKHSSTIGYKKYVQFEHTRRDGCYMREQLGLDFGSVVTTVHLEDRCFWQKWVLHEMMHAMGFRHEHQRVDRDCYIEVFPKERNSSSFIVIKDSPFENWPYDKYSVMHYRKDDRFRVLSKWQPFGNIGELTALDEWKIKFRFCGAPAFCKVYPEYCRPMEEFEALEKCKDKYLNTNGF